MQIGYLRWTFRQHPGEVNPVRKKKAQTQSASSFQQAVFLGG
jgi:hypothetical protein